MKEKRDRQRHEVKKRPAESWRKKETVRIMKDKRDRQSHEVKKRPAESWRIKETGRVMKGKSDYWRREEKQRDDKRKKDCKIEKKGKIIGTRETARSGMTKYNRERDKGKFTSGLRYPEVVRFPDIVTRKLQNFRVTIPRNFRSDFQVTIPRGCATSIYHNPEVAQPPRYNIGRLHNLMIL